jgi:cytochrome P450
MPARPSFDHNAFETRGNAGPLFAELHARCPVFHSESWGGFWAVSRHATLREIGRDSATFASGPGVLIPPLGNGRPLVPMEADGATHSRQRDLLLPHLGPKAVARLEPVVRAITEDLLGGLLPRGEADFYEDYAKRIPAILITRLLGITEERSFWEWTETLIYGRFDREQGAAKVREAAEGVYAYFRDVVAERQAADRNGAGDLVNVLVGARRQGLLTSDEEVVDLCFFLLIAGLDNTAFAIRAVVWHLAAHPSDRRLLLDDPALVRPAVEECLRMYAPVPGLARWVTAPARVEGQEIPAGERVLLFYAAANRDPGLFEDPDTFRLDRPGNPHVAFGVGGHRCIGSHLARLEIRIAIETLLERMPDYELAEPEEMSWHPAVALPIRWTAR